MRGLDGKVAVIAGGGGIGSETAIRLAREGCQVMLGDIALEPAQAVTKHIKANGGDAAAFAYDQSDDASVKALVDAALTQFGRVDFMHANAADMISIRTDGDALTIELDVFDRTVAVNMRGYFSCTRHALPHLIKNRGAIAYTSSSAAHMGEPERVAYAMTKAAVNALMRHVASRWGKDGVRANSIAPGLVLTDQIRNNMSQEWVDQVLAVHRSHRLGQSADIAAMVAHLFSDDGEWITGQVLAVDGGASIRP